MEAIFDELKSFDTEIRVCISGWQLQPPAEAAANDVAAASWLKAVLSRLHSIRNEFNLTVNAVSGGQMPTATADAKASADHSAAVQTERDRLLVAEREWQTERQALQQQVKDAAEAAAAFRSVIAAKQEAAAAAAPKPAAKPAAAAAKGKPAAGSTAKTPGKTNKPAAVGVMPSAKQRMAAAAIATANAAAAAAAKLKAKNQKPVANGKTKPAARPTSAPAGKAIAAAAVKSAPVKAALIKSMDQENVAPVQESVRVNAVLTDAAHVSPLKPNDGLEPVKEQQTPGTRITRNPFISPPAGEAAMDGTSKAPATGGADAKPVTAPRSILKSALKKTPRVIATPSHPSNQTDPTYCGMKTPNLRDFGISDETIAMMESNRLRAEIEAQTQAAEAQLQQQSAPTSAGGDHTASVIPAVPQSSRKPRVVYAFDPLTSPPPLQMSGYASVSSAADPDHGLHHMRDVLHDNNHTASVAEPSSAAAAPVAAAAVAVAVGGGGLFSPPPLPVPQSLLLAQTKEATPPAPVTTSKKVVTRSAAMAAVPSHEVVDSAPISEPAAATEVAWSNVNHIPRHASADASPQPPVASAVAPPATAEHPPAAAAPPTPAVEAAIVPSRSTDDDTTNFPLFSVFPRSVAAPAIVIKATHAAVTQPTGFLPTPARTAAAAAASPVHAPVATASAPAPDATPLMPARTSSAAADIKTELRVAHPPAVTATGTAIKAAAPRTASAPTPGRNLVAPTPARVYLSAIGAVSSGEVTKLPAHLQLPIDELNSFISQLNSYLKSTPGAALTKQSVVDQLGAKGKLVLVLLLHLKRLQPTTNGHNSDVQYQVIA